MKSFKSVKTAIVHSKKNPTDTVEHTSYFNDGQLRVRCYYINGLRYGEYELYYNCGQLWYECFYVNGLEHGECKSYYDNGQLDMHCFFVCGEQHGEYKEYFDDGQIDEHYFFVNGEEVNFNHLIDGSYKSMCIKHTLFNGNVIDEDI